MISTLSIDLFSGGNLPFVAEQELTVKSDCDLERCDCFDPDLKTRAGRLFSY